MAVNSALYDSHTSGGLYAGSIGTTHAVINKAVVTSLSQIAGLNLKGIAIKTTTGTNSYAITGITSTDVIVFAFGMRPSTATYASITAFTPTVSASGKTGSVAISGNVLSGGVAFVGWLDVSL